MGILSADMKRVVRQQRLGFVATVCPDGTPNLSPKGTAAVWDDNHLVFADLASPVTMANLRSNPALEVNIVDVFSRKGYRFKGTARIIEQEQESGLFEEIMDAFESGSRGVHQVRLPARAYVLVKVDRALPLVSPGYVPGKTERETREEWARHWELVQQDCLELLDSESHS
ncbi:MAG: pyridoxamine 5'-phosphate oxidase family protein [Chloroflexi bacterium]|nr:pyridoxamine 5'-phosphate oxidase family protein [Chloroflexota bacterium]